MADAVPVGAGTVILLGAGDFASCSPFSAEVTGNNDPEVVALKALPFERAQLPHLSLKIVPSVDLGSRGGM